MLAILRISLLCLLGGMCAVVQANGFIRDCPSGTATADYVNVHTIFVGSGEIRAFSGASGESLGLLFSLPLDSASSCMFEGEVKYFDRFGNPLDEDEQPETVQLDNSGTFLVMERSFTPSAGGREIIGVQVHGTLTDCMVTEARRFSVTASQLDATGQTRTSEESSLVWFLNHYTDSENIGSDYIATPETPLREVDLACRASAAAAIREAVPQGFIQSFAGWAGSTSIPDGRLVLIVVSDNDFSSCERHDDDGRWVDVVPKVKIEVVVDDSLGNRFTDTVELDAESPSAVLNYPKYPYMDMGERVHQSGLLTATAPSCLSGSPYDMDVRLYQVDGNGRTLTSRRLGRVRYKVPPSQFEDGDGTVEP